VPSSKRNMQQAARVAWRIIKDWIEAQLALVESNQAVMAEVFFPYALEEPQGEKTAFQVFEESKERRAIAAGIAPKSIGAGSGDSDQTPSGPAS
jgi:hypothetical protein